MHFLKKNIFSSNLDVFCDYKVFEAGASGWPMVLWHFRFPEYQWRQRLVEGKGGSHILESERWRGKSHNLAKGSQFYFLELGQSVPLPFTMPFPL